MILQNGEIWENSKKAASEFGIPIVIIDKVKCAESELEKIGTMLDEYSKNNDEQLLQRAMQLFDNNRQGNAKVFDEEKWKEMLESRGIKKRTLFKDREKIEEKKRNSKDREISISELEENYEEISQEKKAKALAELRKRANLIIKESQKENERGE